MAVPVATWPLRVAAADGRTIGVAAALGSGGARVERILARLAAGAPPTGLPVQDLLRATPAGSLDLPVAEVSLDEALQAAALVDPDWMAEVDERRSAPRGVLQAAGRETELEAALNLAMLLGLEGVDEGVDGGVARVASGARLWLLGAAVAWALATDGADGDPFAAWAELVSLGVWPVGPAAGRLVVCLPADVGDAAIAAVAG